MKIIKIPFDTVMNMPVYHRKIMIMKHNGVVKEKTIEMEAEKNGHAINGESINSYAALEQQNSKRKGLI